METKQALSRLKKELLEKVESMGSYFFLEALCDGIGPDALRKLGSELCQDSRNRRIFCSCSPLVSDGKPFVVIGLGDGWVKEKNLDASKMIKEIAPLIGGGGGGQKMLGHGWRTRCWCSLKEGILLSVRSPWFQSHNRKEANLSERSRRHPPPGLSNIPQASSRLSDRPS